jgi:predicted ATPase/signal transduction histidine kinase/GAF domain-containing protein/ActR/RegA family two-component response regulator
MDSTWQAAGLQIADEPRQTLREDGEFVLYRGLYRSSINAVPQPTLVVAPLREHTAPRSLRRLEHEYSLRTELDPAWAVRPLALSAHQGRTVLVLEDPGGEPLDQLVGTPMELRQFLRLAIGLSAALGRLHQHCLIHKDIKPANALVNAASGQVWLMGFGFASRLPRERQAPEPPEVLAGALAYMAPEQTGRMNRSIDSRSDLYSLGVTLYEMLTGSLPFTASHPMEWIHCHIARQPVPPGERSQGVPAPVSAIILKLLAKTAEERYQSAAGVEADLRQCLGEWEAVGRIDTFSLGAHDTSDRLLMPERLYGRNREREALLDAFGQVVASGTSVLVHVSGYSGIGKSSLVHELHKAIVLPRGIFISGKFDQYKRDIPYVTLAQAFRTLIRQILSESEGEVDGWRSAIRKAVGPNGQLIVNLIPELEFVIGKQPLVAELPATEAENRFHGVFRSFLGVFAREEHPLALFLDDLQWLDAATLKLLEHLITHPDVRHLLIIGAFRDNEVSTSHPLMQTLDAIRRTEAVVREIVLAPLSPDDVTQFVADTLHCEHARAEPLAQLVYNKTLGNPFFAIQFLTALAEEGLLAFNADAAAWEWDLPRIRAKGYTDNVVDLMVGKLKRLPDATQERFKQLACLGNVAEIATLTLVHGLSEEEIHTALWDAVRTGLIFRQHGGYAFLHDRVQEAAYGLIPVGERPAIHLRIGRLLAGQTPSGKLEDNIFEIVNQLNRGAGLITSRDERELVAGLNLIAGERAKTSTAYDSALTYLAAGRALLTEEAWEQRYPLMFALEFHRAECEFLSSQLPAAEQRLAALAAHTATVVDSAAVTCLRLELYTTLDRSDRGVELCLEYLRHIGVQWSPHPTKEEVRSEYDEIWRHIGSRSIEALVNLPLMSDPEWRATLDVLAQVVTPALFTDDNLLCLVLCRMANISVEHGNSGASCFAYVWLGMIVGPHFNDYPTAFRFGQLGFELVEQRGLDRFKARVYMSFGNLVNPWTKHVRTGRPLVRRAFNTANEIGDLTFAAYSCNNLITNLLASGEPLADIQREAEAGLAFARKIRFGLVIDIITSQLRLILTLRGLTPAFNSFNDAQFDEARFEQHFEADPRLALPSCWYWIRKLQAHFYAGDYESAIKAELQAQRLLWTSPSFFEVAEYRFHAALARAAYCNVSSADQYPLHVEALAAHHRQLEIWAHHCPANFGNTTALVGAEIARIEGRHLDAERLYEESIRLAQEHGFIQNEAIAGELAARFYAARGLETIAHAYLRNARYCYLRWGADGKVRQLDESYPHLRAELSPTPTTTIGAPVEHLDLATVIKVSQAVSGEIVLEKLIDTLMRTALEHAGAQRGLLIIPHGGAQRLEAEAKISGDTITVRFRHASVSATDLPDSVLHYVVRTQESVILDDASAQSTFAADEYIRRNRIRSVLCLPLIKQTTLIGVLYLENNLTPRVFTPARSAVLKLIASQAAISLENAHLYMDLKQENSERRRAEEALRRSEAYLDQAQAASDTGSFGWNAVTDEMYWSAETFRIYEFDGAVPPELARIVGQTHPEDRDFHEQILDRARHEKKDFDLEYRLLMPDGSVKHLHVVARALADESGGLEFVGAVMDITRRKRVEEAQRVQEREREEMQRQLQQAAKMEAIGRLAGGIAHDFNNILGAILGYGELAQSSLVEGGAVRHQIDQVMYAGIRGKGLVDRILAFSHSGVGDRLPVLLQSVVEETLELLAASLPADVRLERRLDAADMAVVGDATQFHQVVMNLCTNAVHAMERAGVLTVALDRVAVDDRRLLSHGTLCAGGYVRLLVSDTGGGIPPAVLKRMFDPFFTTKRVGDGTGLGLALVHGIVADFDGVIDVATQLGAGSTFTIWLPTTGKMPRLLAEPAREVPRGSGETVMIVDDERALVALAEDTLAELGYEPVGFDSSVAALQAFRAEPKRFDLVLTDETMPDLTGTELAREIRQLRPEISIILMSGYSSAQVIERARAAGVMEVLRKPLVRRDIAEPVARALRARNELK